MTNKFGYPDFDWLAAKVEAKAILVQQAKSPKSFITYSDLVHKLRSIEFKPQDQPFAELLGEISKSEDAAGRGLLSALVVDKINLKPGQGFFKLAQQLGRNTKDRDAFWLLEVKRVRKEWSGISPFDDAVEPLAPTSWTENEIREIVADYFSMLRLEAAGLPYNKSEHNENLRQRIQRSKGSVEMKHQNISAVLAELGLPWIDGYKPAKNVQQLLRDYVGQFVMKNNVIVDQIITAFSGVDSMAIPTVNTWQELFQELPEAVSQQLAEEQAARVRLPRKCNYAERDDLNRKLGRAGEEFVVAVERSRLKSLGRADLAERVSWIADELGDGCGYDILSFDENGMEIFIEVKTTNNPRAQAQFMISRNELEVSNEKADQFRLYRIYNFNKSPKIYQTRGSLSCYFQLEPLSYTASILKKSVC